MTAIEIADLVQAALGVDVRSFTERTPENNDAKLLAVLLMLEYGIPVPVIAGIINRDRTLVYSAKKRATELLETDKIFKSKYWTCNALRLAIEERVVAA